MTDEEKKKHGMRIIKESFETMRHFIIASGSNQMVNSIAGTPEELNAMLVNAMKQDPSFYAALKSAVQYFEREEGITMVMKMMDELLKEIDLSGSVPTDEMLIKKLSKIRKSHEN